MLRPFFWCQEFDWDLKSQFGRGQLTPWSVSMIMFAWCLVMWTRWLPGVRRWRGQVWATLDPPEAGQRSDSGGERWGMMLNNPFIMQHPPGADNKRTQFGAWRAPQLLPLSPGWKSFFIWKTNIYFRNARSESLHQSPLPRLETERQCCNDNKPQSDPGQDLWSFLHLICNFQRVIITSLRALYTASES